MPRITRADVLHVAKLARLTLSDDEVDLFTGQFEVILEHVAQIEALDTDGVPPTAHPLELGNVLRPDVPGPCLTASQALGNAPDAHDGRFRVPPP